MALDNNAAFRVQRIEPQRVRTREDTARAAFDPALNASLARTERHGPEYALKSGSTSDVSAVSDKLAAKAAATATLPTGTRFEVGAGTDVDTEPADRAQSRVGLTLTQPLLEGFGTAPTLVELRQARLDTRMSVHVLEAAALSLVAQVESACWKHTLARMRRDTYADALRVAEQQLAETRERIRVGKLATLEAVAAEAEVALRREGLIQADSDAETARLRLLRLLNPPRADLWQLQPSLTDAAIPPAGPLPQVDSTLESARRERPDLKEARLLIERNELELVKTHNGLLPKLDAFIALGRSGYASSFGDSAVDPDDTGRDATIGVQLDIPLVNRSARAGHRRAVLGREQAAAALANLTQLAEEDVRVAWVQADFSRAQVDAALSTRTLQERKLEAETAKFREGKSTGLLVAQAERDVLQSRLAYEQAVVSAILARTELFRQDASLLARRGLRVSAD